LIFVLSASLVVALIYLPVMGGVSGRMSRTLNQISNWLRLRTPWWLRAVLIPPSMYMMFLGAMQMLNPAYLVPAEGFVGVVFGALVFLTGAFSSSVTLSAARIEREARRVERNSSHTPFGHFIKFIAGNPIMPIISIAVVFFAVITTITLFQNNNRGVEFFVESEPEQATTYVRARGNLSLHEKDELVRQVEEIIAAHPAVINVFSFAGEGGLDTGGPGGSQSPADTVGQVQFEIIPWEDRPHANEPLTGVLGGLMYRWLGFEKETIDPNYDGDFVIEQLNAELVKLPGIIAEVSALEQGPGQGKPVHLRIKGDGWEELTAAAELARAQFEDTPGLIKIEDTLPLPGIDWQIDVDVAKAGRFGADVATVGAMVQLVTRGVLLGEMRPENSDEEIEIRVRLPDEDRVLSTLDVIKVRTPDGLVPLSNFISRKPVEKLATISRVNQLRYYDVKADVIEGIEILQMIPLNEDGTEAEDGKLDVGFGYEVSEEDAADGAPVNVTLTAEPGFFWSLFFDPTVYRYHVPDVAQSVDLDVVQGQLDSGNATVKLVPMNPNERIAKLTEWLDTNPLPTAVEWEWTGDQEEQEESGAFLMNAFAGALGLMFIILLAQFNSFYNSVLVLLAVVLSTTGVLIGMMVMNQPFSIIMTGTGIVALAGIVVNNNIVLIDTYQEYSQYMPRIEAIIRTAEARIRPVLLTTITTMAGLTPMMFGLSLDFIGGGYSIDSPTALWWKQLATAVVFGLGIATVLTLVLTPSFLALRVWVSTYLVWFGRLLTRITAGRSSRAARDMRLFRTAKKLRATEILWDAPDAPFDITPGGNEPDPDEPELDLHFPGGGPPLKAAE
ncbi:MAG: efflux RND transporter permease subunit, partial [Pseudomonadota bacterium]